VESSVVKMRLLGEETPATQTYTETRFEGFVTSTIAFAAAQAVGAEHGDWVRTIALDQATG
jgi:hypothetical protein